MKVGGGVTHCRLLAQNTQDPRLLDLVSSIGDKWHQTWCHMHVSDPSNQEAEVGLPKVKNNLANILSFRSAKAIQ